MQPMEAKWFVNPVVRLAKAFEVLNKASVSGGNGAILYMRPELSAVDRG